MIISLDTFLRTGQFGDLRHGMLPEEVQLLLDTPDDMGGTSRQHPQPSIFLYGAVELWFAQRSPRHLTGIWWEAGDKGDFRLSPACIVKDWEFTPNWTFRQIQDYLQERDISFEHRNEPSIGYPPSLILPSGITLSFAPDEKLWGILRLFSYL